VWNKSDLDWPAPRDGLRISAKTGEGLDALLAALQEQVRKRLDRPREAAPMTRARHRECVTAAVEIALPRLEGHAERTGCRRPPPRAARHRPLTGRVDIEELLDTVFRDFCIGK